MEDKYIPPSHSANAFHCPHCKVFAHQYWGEIMRYIQAALRQDKIIRLSISTCTHCNEWALWLDNELLYPFASLAPFPCDDMPIDVKDDYIEASNIVNFSPRAAVALLRLALQKLMADLGETGSNLNDNIGNLVKKGLPPKIQKALDSIRVIGNNAVHPGQLDLKDDKETALSLFELINIIVEVMITEPKRIDSVYDKVPQSQRDAIDKRNGK